MKECNCQCGFPYPVSTSSTSYFSSQSYRRGIVRKILSTSENTKSVVIPLHSSREEHDGLVVWSGLSLNVNLLWNTVLSVMLSCNKCWCFFVACCFYFYLLLITFRWSMYVAGGKRNHSRSSAAQYVVSGGFWTSLARGIITCQADKNQWLNN